MPPAISPRNESSSRTWWSLSSKGTSSKDQQQPFSADKSPRDSSRKRNDSHKFNTLATAIGFKSKKHPSLAIQDPPSPVHPVISPPEPSYRSEASPKYTNRPPSKSVSSTRSRVDSIEPRTPLDGQRDTASHRHSLLTLSDIDPFAARGISVPHTAAVDPNRLSAYSNSSVAEFVSKRVEELPVNRGSYASSSSHSYPDEVTLVSPTFNEQLTNSSTQKKLATSHLTPEDPWHALSGSNMVKSNSSSTLTDKNRLSQPDPAPSPRPPMRARGLTDSGSNPQRSKFLQDVRSSPKPSPSSNPSSPPISPGVSPRVVVRQPSIQRMGLPVSAPPNQRLPPPPVIRDILDDDDPLIPEFNGSAESSSLSFISHRDGGIANQHYIPRSKARERGLLPSSPAAGSTPDVGSIIKSHNPPRTLKKAVSHQSLTKGTSSSGSSIAFPPDTPPERAPRKQRSFHHPRIPLPPIPNPLRHQSISSSISSPDNGSSSDPKRGSVGSPPASVRTRLFSGSSMRRTSTSHDRPGEEDVRSVFSLPLDRDRPLNTSLKNFGGGSTVSSFWDEGGDRHPPSSPHASTSTADYTPQQIMSPAEMLKLEASVQESFSFSRSRGMSVVSASTFTTESDHATSPTGPSATVAPDLLTTTPHLLRSSSVMHKSGGVVPPRLPRPSTAQGSMSSPVQVVNAQPSSSFVSLRPPPRPRRPPTSPVISGPTESPRLIPLSPPPRTKGVHKQNLADKGLRRTSVMRKPSFLDIDDEADQRAKPLHREDSFLDLARESMDTVRSDADDERS